MTVCVQIVSTKVAIAGIVTVIITSHSARTAVASWRQTAARDSRRQAPISTPDFVVQEVCVFPLNAVVYEGMSHIIGV